MYKRQVQKKSTKLSILLSNIIAGFVTLKMSSGVKIVLNHFYEECEEAFQLEKSRVKVEASFEMTAFLLGVIGSFGTIIAGAVLVSEGTLDFGTVMAVVTLQMSVSNAMQRLGGSISALTTSMVRASHVFDFMELDMEEQINWFTDEKSGKKELKGENSDVFGEMCIRDSVYAYAATIPENSTVLLDKRKVNYRITNALSETVHIVSKANPSQLMKSIKNEIELENTRKAHLLDGIAVTKFMYWLKKNVGKIPMDEVSVSDYLQSLREQMEGYRDISFDTIAGYNANAAMMHYKAEPDTAAKLEDVYKRQVLMRVRVLFMFQRFSIAGAAIRVPLLLIQTANHMHLRLESVHCRNIMIVMELRRRLTI